VKRSGKTYGPRRSKTVALLDTEALQNLQIRVRANPLFIRLPAPGTQCPYTGLSRGGMADLCAPSKANAFKPPVKSIALKKNKYVKRAIRLIDFESLIRYLRDQFKKAA
jgi:hypothetical protein